LRLSSAPPEADNARQICSVLLRSLAAFDVLRQLVEGLITEFDCAEADPRVALSLRWMQLPQSDDCLAIALFIERDGGAEYARTLSPWDPILFHHTAILWARLRGVLAAGRPDGESTTTFG
jgi:hypothetical protein